MGFVAYLKKVTLIIALHDLDKNLSAYCHKVKYAISCALGIKDECDSRKFCPFIIFSQGVGQARSRYEKI